MPKLPVRNDMSNYVLFLMTVMGSPMPVNPPRANKRSPSPNLSTLKEVFDSIHSLPQLDHIFCFEAMTEEFLFTIFILQLTFSCFSIVFVLPQVLVTNLVTQKCFIINIIFPISAFIYNRYLLYWMVIVKSPKRIQFRFCFKVLFQVIYPSEKCSAQSVQISDFQF